MYTRRNEARRLEDKDANGGAPLHDDQDPPFEESDNVYQALVNLSPMMEVEMRDIITQIAQGMTTQAQAMMFQS